MKLSRKLALDMLILGGVWYNVIPVMNLIVGYNVPPKLLLWIRLLQISVAAVFMFAGLQFYRKYKSVDKESACLFMLNVLYGLAEFSGALVVIPALCKLWLRG